MKLTILMIDQHILCILEFEIGLKIRFFELLTKFWFPVMKIRNCPQSLKFLENSSKRVQIEFICQLETICKEIFEIELQINKKKIFVCVTQWKRQNLVSK